jgi:hypothetical protein
LTLTIYLKFKIYDLEILPISSSPHLLITLQEVMRVISYSLI